MTEAVSFDILHEIEEEHRELDREYADFRGLLADADPSRPAIIRQRFDQLHALLQCHFAREEGDGFFDEVLEMAPRLSQRVIALQAEHEVLLQRLAEFDVRITATTDLLAEYDCFCRDFDEFLTACSEHEAAETLLVQDAHLIDVGGEG